jgi:hypothetical protein
MKLFLLTSENAYDFLVFFGPVSKGDSMNVFFSSEVK